ncbi:MAG: flagellar hook-basal body complex protein [Candidatus Hydrogenedentota bacterium]
MIDFSTPLSAIKTGLSRENVIANNVANVNTTGFKSSDVYQNGLNISGTQISSISRDFTQGSMMLTGDNLSLTVAGDGFFKVLTPKATAYTRDGNFNIDATGRVVTSSGYPITPEIKLPENTENLTITKKGEVFAYTNGESQRVGQIELVKFTNPSGLIAAGENLYYKSANSGEPVPGLPGFGGLGEIVQGYLESSNVDLASEFVHSIINENAIKANINVIKVMDEMSQEILRLT